jgi:hypothetical protein
MQNILKDGVFRQALVRLFVAQKNLTLPDNFDFDFQIVKRVNEPAMAGTGSFLFDLKISPQASAFLLNSEYTPATFLAGVLGNSYEGFVETALAASYGAELTTTSTLAETIAAQLHSTLQQTFPASSQIAEFYTAVTPQLGSVRGAINSGNREFRDFLTLLKSARKFKEDIAGKHPDASLLQHYIERLTCESYFDRLPVKILRFLFFNLGGFIGDQIVPGASFSLGAIDSFILDKIARGWRPNQFVATALKPFLNV